MRTLLRAALAMLFVMCLTEVALAQVAPTPSSPIPGLSGWAGLIVVACMAASFALRNWTSSTNFFHTQYGALVLAGLSALIPAVQQWAQSGALSVNTLTPLVLGALASLFAMSKPVGTDKKEAAKAEAMKPAAATPPAPPSS